MAAHFITFSGSNMLNSRARVEAYEASLKKEGATAAPTSIPALSACSRRDWATQPLPIVAIKVTAPATDRAFFTRIGLPSPLPLALFEITNDHPSWELLHLVTFLKSQ